MILSPRTARMIPPRCGVGLRARHLAEVVASRPAVGWFEVHAENYMSRGPALEALAMIRRDYPVSLHGVGLSLGSAGGADRGHLARLCRLAERIEPGLVSEHLAWSTAGGTCLNDLLPLPYTQEALDLDCRDVDIPQEALGRRILVENPSGYLRFLHDTMSEPEFLAVLASRTGCGILLDVNNVLVSANNLDFDPRRYIDAIPAGLVDEIHLAGHARSEADGVTVLIDDHGSPVPPLVSMLHARAIGRFGLVPSLVEWDTDVPALDVLLAEAARADALADAVLTNTVGEGPRRAAAG